MKTTTPLRLCAAMAAGLLLAVLGACAGAPGGYDPSKLSAEQLKAVTADKADTVSCGFVTGSVGRATTIYVNLDKSAAAAGTVTVDAECKTTVTIAGPPAKAAAAASSP